MTAPPTPARPCIRELFGVRDLARVEAFGPWDVMIHARNAPRHAEWARTGALHLQLVHVGRGVRIVTPCSLTDGAFEVHHTERIRTGCLRRTAHHIERHHGLPVPPPCFVRRNLYIWVYPAYIAVRGGEPEPDTQRRVSKTVGKFGRS